MKKILIIFMMLFCVISINNTIIINADAENNEYFVSKLYIRYILKKDSYLGILFIYFLKSNFLLY